VTDLTEPQSVLEAAAPRRRARGRLAWVVGPARLSLGGENLVFAVLVAIPLLWMLGYLLPPINHDAAVVLDVSRRWLAGERLYVDVIDVNTPLVFIVYALPVLLGQSAGISAEAMLIVCLIAGIVASFLACRHVVKFGSIAERPLTAALLPTIVLFLLAVLPSDMFGQREHIMLIASMPYLLLAGERADGLAPPRRLAALSALFAGIGFAMKPYFLGMPLLIESYLLWRHGPRRAAKDPTPWMLLAAGVAHALFAVLVTPEYFTSVLPMALEYYAPLGDSHPLDTLTNPLIAPTVLALVPLGASALFVSRSRLTLVIALYALGGVISAVAQGKGWAYHSLPALTATLLLAAVVVATMIDRHLPIDRVAHRLPVAVVTAGFMLLFYYQAALFKPPFINQRYFDDSIAGRLLNVVQQNAGNKRALILSPGIYPHFPVLNYAGVRNILRFESMWLLQGIYSGCDEQEFSPLYNPPEAMAPAEAFLFRNVAENFARKKPSLLIVDTVAGIPQCQAHSFDYLEYFLRNPLFARSFESYELLMDLDRYKIYRRK
jgi:hypothetical protein